MEGLGADGFWQGKRVFVTGHTGFKGSWLSLLLRELGATVRGFALAPPSDPSLFAKARIAELVGSTTGDIRDYELLHNSMRDFAPDIVLHLAAQALVRKSYREPVATYATNVMGTVHVLEAVRQLPSVRVVVNVTSDKCYQNLETLRGYQEHQAMGGHDPYSSSKGCAELVASAYRTSYFAESGVALGSVRAGNVIGGGDWAEDRLIPDILRSFSRGQSVEIRNPASIRPWQHVLDPLGGYLLLAERLWTHGQEYAEGWNFGPRDEDAQPVEYILDRMVERWGDGAAWHLTADAHPHEARYLKLDCTKARTRLGWAPRTTLDKALTWSVDWYRGYLRGTDPRLLCREQIQEFLRADKEKSCARPVAAFAKAS